MNSLYRTACVAAVLAFMVLVVCVGLAGCESAPPSLHQVNQVAEFAVFQPLHLVDTIQTYHGPASDACYGEGDVITSRLIGRKPSRAGVVEWGVGYAAVHYGVYRLLSDNGHDYLAAAWEALTIGTTGQAVVHNFNIGIRIGAPNLLTDGHCGGPP